MELFENGLILRRLEPSCVSFQHRRNGFCGVIVGLEFVVSLLGMKAFAGDVLLPLADQEIADALEHGDYNFFLKVMPLYVKVGIVGSNTQLCEALLSGIVRRQCRNCSLAEVLSPFDPLSAAGFGAIVRQPRV